MLASDYVNFRRICVTHLLLPVFQTSNLATSQNSSGEQELQFLLKQQLQAYYHPEQRISRVY